MNDLPEFNQQNATMHHALFGELENCTIELSKALKSLKRIVDDIAHVSDLYEPETKQLEAYMKQSVREAGDSITEFRKGQVFLQQSENRMQKDETEKAAQQRFAEHANNSVAILQAKVDKILQVFSHIEMQDGPVHVESGLMGEQSASGDRFRALSSQYADVVIGPMAIIESVQLELSEKVNVSSEEIKFQHFYQPEAFGTTMLVFETAEIAHKNAMSALTKVLNESETLFADRSSLSAQTLRDYVDNVISGLNERYETQSNAHDNLAILIKEAYLDPIKSKRVSYEVRENAKNLQSILEEETQFLAKLSDGTFADGIPELDIKSAKHNDDFRYLRDRLSDVGISCKTGFEDLLTHSDEIINRIKHGTNNIIKSDSYKEDVMKSSIFGATFSNSKN